METNTSDMSGAIPPSLTLEGALIQLLLVVAYLIGPSIILYYMFKVPFKSSVITSLYSGVLSFLLLIALNPLGFLAVLVAFPVYMWSLKIRLGVDWQESFRYTLVIWGVYLLPLLIIGGRILTRFTV